MTLGIGRIPGLTWHGRTVTGMRLMMTLEKKNVPEPVTNLLLKVLKKPWQQTGLGLRLRGRASRSEKIVGLVSLHQILPLRDVSTAVEIIEYETALTEMLHQTRVRAMASTCTTPGDEPYDNLAFFKGKSKGKPGGKMAYMFEEFYNYYVGKGKGKGKNNVKGKFQSKNRNHVNSYYQEAMDFHGLQIDREPNEQSLDAAKVEQENLGHFGHA